MVTDIVDRHSSRAPMFGSSFPVYSEPGRTMDNLLKFAVEAHGAGLKSLE